MLGFIEQPQRGWGDVVVAGGLAGGAVLLAAFVVWEMRTPQPMLPLRLFGMRNFSVTNIETFAVYGGLSTWGFFLALFLQQISAVLAVPLRACDGPGDDRHVLPVALCRTLLDALSGRASSWPPGR